MNRHHPIGLAASLVFAAVVLHCVIDGSQARAAVGTLVVSAGKQARTNVPMSVPLPQGVTKAAFRGKDEHVPHDVKDGRLWWILDTLPAGATRTYDVSFDGSPPAGSPGVEMKQAGGKLDIRIGGKPFTSYVYSPKPSGKHVLRRPLFFPVYGPRQTTMTRPFPMVLADLPKNVATDHPHHTSIYVAHGAVNGVDNWSIGPKAGYIVHKTFETVAGGAAMGMFRETLDWTDVAKKPVMHETRVVRVYRLPDAIRMLDIEITFHAKYGAVTFGDTKEGGLCSVRMRPELRADSKATAGRLVNSAGNSAGGAWGKKAQWVDCSGEVAGRRVGMAILDAPGNLRHPTTWHARTYGLLTANPFGLSHFTRKKQQGEYTLAPGKQKTWRYRIIFHEGDENAAKIADRFGDYASPPTAAWR